MPSLTDILGSTFISFLNTKTDNIGDVDMCATDFNQIGINIQNEMNSKNISVHDMAKRLDIPMKAVADIINGSKAINMNELTKIAEAIGVSVDSLIYFVNDQARGVEIVFDNEDITSRVISEISLLETLLADAQ